MPTNSAGGLSKSNNTCFFCTKTRVTLFDESKPVRQYSNSNPLYAVAPYKIVWMYGPGQDLDPSMRLPLFLMVEGSQLRAAFCINS